MKDRKTKFLTENAKITNAYLNIYRNVNEEEEKDKNGSSFENPLEIASKMASDVNSDVDYWREQHKKRPSRGQINFWTDPEKAKRKAERYRRREEKRKAREEAESAARKNNGNEYNKKNSVKSDLSNKVASNASINDDYVGNIDVSESKYDFSEKENELKDFNDWMEKQPVANIHTGTGDSTYAKPFKPKTQSVTSSRVIRPVQQKVKDSFETKLQELKDFNDWMEKQPVANIHTGTGGSTYAKPPQPKTQSVTSSRVIRPFETKLQELKDFNDWMEKQPVANIHTEQNSNSGISESFEEDNEPSNDSIYKEYVDFVGGREPCVETKEGVIYIEYDPSRNVLKYGTATNTGLLEDGNVEYDKDMTMQWNMQNVIDEIFDKFGEYDEEMDEE